MSSQAIPRRGLQTEIQEVVRRYIIDHRFRPGDPLPGEGELARQMGISRPSLREAMKVLQTIGVVESRHGSGTYVGQLSLDALADGLAFQVLLAAQNSAVPPAELLDLVDLREGIETRLIGRVAGRHTPNQIARMRAVNTALAQVGDHSAEFSERDLELHLLFYEPLDSRVNSEFVRVFWKVSNLTIRPYARNPHRVIAGQHGAIIDALAAHDADAAITAMTEHLRRVVQTIDQSYDPRHMRNDALGISDEATRPRRRKDLHGQDPRATGAEKGNSA